jgi:hypothetical protein
VGCRLPYWTGTCLMESRRLETCSLSVRFALWTLNTREVFTSVTSPHRYVKGRGCPPFLCIPPSPFGGGGLCRLLPSRSGHRLMRNSLLPYFPFLSPFLPSLHRGFPLASNWWRQGCCILAAEVIIRSDLWASF